MISKDDLQHYKAELDEITNELLANLPHREEAFQSKKRHCQEASDQYAAALMLYAEQVGAELAQAYFQQSRQQGENFRGFLWVLTDYQKRHNREV